MKTYPELSAVDLEFILADANGNPITATNASATLTDSDGDVLLTISNSEIVIEDPIKISIPVNLNALGAGMTLDVRVLKVRLDTPEGVIMLKQSYMIKGEQELVTPTNSFSTYEKALLIASGIVNLTGWNTASEELRVVALREAYSNIIRITFAFDVDASSYRNKMTYDNTFDIFGSQRVVSSADWTDMTRADFDELPIEFRAALMKAQLLEANDLIQGDVLAAKIRSGIVTETIGESSMTLNKNMLRHAVSPVSITVLGPYIYNRTLVARG